MAIKQIELESHATEYHERMQAAQAAQRQGLYRIAVDMAVSAWAYVDGMMRYEQKYRQTEFTTVPAIDMVLQYAPLLLDYHRLNQLAKLLDENWRIGMETSTDMGQTLGQARSRMWDNHRLWSFLEANPDTPEDRLCKALGGEVESWQMVIGAWMKMGLLRCTIKEGTRQFSLLTRMGKVVSGKCPACGRTAKAPKAMFLEPMACPKCRSNVLFVLMGE